MYDIGWPDEVPWEAIRASRSCRIHNQIVASSFFEAKPGLIDAGDPDFAVGSIFCEAVCFLLGRLSTAAAVTAVGDPRIGHGAIIRRGATVGEHTRAFAALTIGREDHDAIGRLSAAMRERPGGAELKWVRPEIIHLTVRFFGDLDRKQLAKASEAIRSLDHDFTTPRASFGSIGAFPSCRRPQVIWLGIDDTGGEVVELADRVDMAIRRIGFGRADKPFVPHLTLARVGRDRRSPDLDLLTDGLTPPNGPLRIRSVTLFQSELRPQGPLYTPLVVARPREESGDGETAGD